MGSKKLFLAIVLLGASAFAQNNLVPVPPELDSLGGVLRFVERQLGPIDSRRPAHVSDHWGHGRVIEESRPRHGRGLLRLRTLFHVI